MTTLKTQPEALESQDEELSRLRAEVAAWRARYAASSTRDLAFVNSGGVVAPLFSALDTAAGSDRSVAGAFPFTRGIHPTG
jgi:methylmalonyl-CoA mutase N-terminal domain/subunit